MSKSEYLNPNDYALLAEINQNTYGEFVGGKLPKKLRQQKREALTDLTRNLILHDKAAGFTPTADDEK